jgi:hypothetical protein
MNTEKTHTETSGTDKIAWALLAVMLLYEVLK